MKFTVRDFQRINSRRCNGGSRRWRLHRRLPDTVEAYNALRDVFKSRGFTNPYWETKWADFLATVAPEAWWDGEKWHGLTAAVVPVDARVSPKGTTEVVEALSQTSNRVHGGDGASGEVDHASEKPSDANRASDQSAKAGQNNDPAPDAKASSSMSHAETPPSAGASGAGAGDQPKVTSVNSSESGVTAENHDLRAGVANNPAQESTLPVESRALLDELDNKKRAEVVPSASKNGNPLRGGSLSRKGYYSLNEHTHVRISVVQRVNRALDKWMADMGDEVESGRWNYAELVIRARTMSGIQRARKTDNATPALLVMCDVSGSCRGFAEYALNVAYAIQRHARGNRNMIIVTHSNGSPIEMSVNSSSPTFVHMPNRARVTDEVSWFVELAQKHEISHVVALGDDDAIAHYEGLVRHPRVESFVWLDNYASSRTKPTKHKWVVKGAVNHYARVIGCANDNDFADAIAIAANSTLTS